MNKDELQALVQSKVAQAEALIAEAEELTEKNELPGFSLDVAYGMGGTYMKAREYWESSDVEETYQWMASSQSC